MATKNLMDASENKQLLVFYDKTGEYKEGPRMELADALQFVHDAYSKMLTTEDPKPHRFAIQFALQNICQHTGWRPFEIAAAEQYATLLSSTGSAASAG